MAKARGLSEKDKILALAYLRTQSPKQAAIIAGHNEKTAAAYGHKRLQAKVVKEYIEKIKNAYGETPELEKLKSSDLMKEVMSLPETLQRLSKIARREEKEYTVVTLKSCKTYYDEDGKKVTEMAEEPQTVAYDAKLSDVNRALEQLVKYHTIINPQDNDTDGEGGIVIIPEAKIKEIESNG